MRWNPLGIELSKLYKKYRENIDASRHEYEEQLTIMADHLKTDWDVCLNDSVYSYKTKFGHSDYRLILIDNAQRFFGITDQKLSFAAIDGSCDVVRSDRFISIYGGAYASRGYLEISGDSNQLSYKRNLERDISYVAFLPVPPIAIKHTIESGNTEEGTDFPLSAMSDQESASFSVLQTRMMDLAESYAAYDLSRSTQEYPNLILMDKTISGWLANTSFVDLVRSIIGKEIFGETITELDLIFSIAHPFNKTLNVPTASTWLPFNKIFAECYHKNNKKISYYELSSDMSKEYFMSVGKYIRDHNYGDYDQLELEITLKENPKSSWIKMKRIYENLCNELFDVKNWEAIKCIKDGYITYLTSREFQFFSGVGLRLLIERCWDKKILLIGIVKDSSSRYFFRNYLGTIHLNKGLTTPGIHIDPGFSDRTILETLPYVLDPEQELESPWSSIEFDSCFMTIRPQKISDDWFVKGYRRATGQEYTRPSRLILRSLAQFLVTKRTSSHVIFLDRLAYSGWDDRDSTSIDIEQLGSELGPIEPLFFEKPARLHELSVFLLTILIKNHFPEALGYPDPLHKADLAATSFRRQIGRILKSSTIVDKSNPLTQTLTKIRNRVRSKR
ncbi:MAG: DNA double-strand break repair nuclease NurA [Candidatus Heimdallarchaeaceae archaeon]